jgi:CO/xanthine dehydrogenase Mo-binding subunit
MVGAGRRLKQVVLEHALLPRPGAWGGPSSPPFFEGLTIDELDMKDSMVFEKANPGNNVTLKQIGNAFESTMWGGSNLYAWHYAPAVTPAVTMEVMCRQCYFMEVEVDPDTGKCYVKKVVVVNDPGRVMNPDACNGQQYGGVYMAIGRSNTEEVIFDPQTGVKLNDSLVGYGIALMDDCSGEIDCHLVETGLGYSAYGTCGIGESGNAAAQWLTA